MQAQERQLEGKLLSESDSLPIQYAHVINSDKKAFAVTDPMGKFTIKAGIGDTLEFSSIGYEKKLFAIGFSKEDLLVFYIKQADYVLNDIIIYGDTSRLRGFLEPSRSPYLKPRKKTTFEDELKYSTPSFNGLSATGLFTALANQFNDRFQQMKKLDGILKEEQKKYQYEYLLQERLPNSFVIKHSSLLENEIEDFLTFWHPSTYILEHSNDYALIRELREKEEAYTQLLKRQDPDSNTVSTIELRKLLER